MVCVCGAIQSTRVYIVILQVDCLELCICAVKVFFELQSVVLASFPGSPAFRTASDKCWVEAWERG